MSAGGEIAALQQALAGAKHPRERHELAGKLLAACGGPVRSREGAGEAVDAALRGLVEHEIEGWLATVDAQSVKADLARAGEAALEAALAESDGERGEWETWTLEALGSRDALDRALCALARWEKLTGKLTEAAQRARERIHAELARVDAGGPALARRLVTVNRARRPLRDALDGEHRERAWWYSARSECDALAQWWSDPAKAPAPDCDACAKDRQNARLAEKPPDACVTESELWDLDAGALAPARRRLIEKHARACGECAQALQALTVSPEAEATTETEGRSAPAPEVVAQRPEFRVLYFRERRARVVIAPAPGVRLAAAAVQHPRIAAKLDGAPLASGVEVDLGPLDKVAGARAKLTVTLGDGKRVELELGL